MRSVESLAAGWYRWMGLAGFLLSVVIFLLYGLGVLPTHRPVWKSAEYWSGSAADLRTESGSPYGPGRLPKVADGAVASTLALALPAGSAIPTLIALSIAWFRRGDRLYGNLALGVAAVLLMAVAGLP